MQEALKELISASRSVVFFGGAGVSTESGIPDFRSVDGLYQQQYAYPPEVILSHDFFVDNPGEFFRFYRNKLLHPKALPNAAHRALARLEGQGKLCAVITQNIDGLHQKAGSRNVLELHGSVWRNHCEACGRFWGLAELLNREEIPRCTCGGIIKPDVVLYGEPLEETVFSQAVKAIAGADLLIVGGTSLAVYPAAGLIDCLQGGKLVVINRSPTPADRRADLRLEGLVGEILSGAVGEDPAFCG